VSDSERADITWRKSTASGGGDCVEVAFTEGAVLVRKSQDPLGPKLSFSRSEWIAFLAGTQRGEFDLPGADLRGRAVIIRALKRTQSYLKPE
jgi:hypothetical protein